MLTDSSNNSGGKWSPWAGIVVAILAFIGAEFISSLIISIYPLIKGWSINHANTWQTNSVTAQFVFVLIAEVILVGSIYLFLRGYKDSFKSIGLRKPKWSDISYGLIGLPAYLVLYFIIVNIAVNVDHNLNISQKQQLNFNNVHGAFELIITFISLVILPPIAEEILFRGLLYSSLKKLLPISLAVIGTSLLFAAGHLPEGGNTGPLYIAALDTFSLSLILIYLREKTGGLYSSILLHALKNGIAFVAIFVLHQS